MSNLVELLKTNTYRIEQIYVDQAKDCFPKDNYLYHLYIVDKAGMIVKTYILGDFSNE